MKKQHPTIVSLSTKHYDMATLQLAMMVPSLLLLQDRASQIAAIKTTFDAA